LGQSLEKPKKRGGEREEGERPETLMKPSGGGDYRRVGSEQRAGPPTENEVKKRYKKNEREK